jgi:flagellin
MSFRINTNVAAMGTLRNVTQNSLSLNSSINRLSTGLRINSAGDDPAGLIASEGFRAQITGMDAALRNNQDAVNFAKTAESALSEVNRLLNDARALAISSANTGTLSSSQVQANQDQLSSIVSSVTRIAQNTTFGTKKLLDGTAGINSQVTNAVRVASISLGSTVGSATLSSNATITLSSVTAGTKATYMSATLTGGNVLAAGSFSLNGTTFTFAAGQTGNEVVSAVNAASAQTGVTAVLNGANRIEFTSTKVGSNARIDFVDAQGVISAAAGTTAAQTGTNATATVEVGGSGAVLFTGGLNGSDGLTLRDANGNTLKLTDAGNATTGTAAAVGQVVVGSAQFQIGANANQTASLSIGNFAASQLGQGVVSGLNLSNLDLTSASGANNALQVIDQAITEVSRARGSIGNFQRNVLESNIRSLGTARENLAATESSIRDTDVAAEMTQYTKSQILQQAGLSVLAQANSAPQAVLSLLR